MSLIKAGIELAKLDEYLREIRTRANNMKSDEKFGVLNVATNARESLDRLRRELTKENP